MTLTSEDLEIFNTIPKPERWFVALEMLELNAARAESLRRTESGVMPGDRFNKAFEETKMVRAKCREILLAGLNGVAA